MPAGDGPILRAALDGWTESATARAYDVEYDIENDVVVSVRERAVDTEWSAQAAQARLDFFGEQAGQEMPWTQMRVDYSFDGTVYPSVQSIVRTEIGEDFLDDAAKAYEGESEFATTARFVLQTDRQMLAGDFIDVELHAPDSFGTRLHRLVFSGESFVADQSQFGDSLAPLKTAGGNPATENQCGLLEVFPDYNRAGDENRIDLVFAGIENDVPFEIEDYLVGMIDIYDERSVMIVSDGQIEGGNAPLERRGVFGLDPLHGNHHLFNFWYLPESYAYADALDDPDALKCTRKFDDVLGDCFPDQPNEYRVYLGTDIDCRSSAEWGSHTVVDVLDSSPYASTGTITHELGHVLFELADEYEDEDEGDSPRFPNCLDGGEMARAVELGFPDPNLGCSYTDDNIRPSEASVMRTPMSISFDELNQRWICMKLAEHSGYPLRGICSGTSLGFPSTYRHPECHGDSECSSGVCSAVAGPGHCLAGSLPNQYRCDRDEQCLSGLCRPGLAGYSVCYETGRTFGEACLHDEECDDLCIGATPGARGKCAPPQGVGQLCLNDAQCASAICSSMGNGEKRCQEADKEPQRRCYSARECATGRCGYDPRLCTQPHCYQEPASTPMFCAGIDLPPGTRCYGSDECRGYNADDGADCYDYSQGPCIQRCGYARTSIGFTRETVCMSYGQASWDECDFDYQCPSGHACTPSAGPDGRGSLRYRCVPSTP